MSIGSNIKSLRESLGMTQDEFGKIAGLTGKAVSTWESDKKVPRMGAIQRIADYFNIPKSALFEELTKDGTSSEFSVIQRTANVASEKNIGQKIRELRLANRLTLEQVADRVGVEKSTVKKWETGMIANMRRDKIAALADALNTTPEYLMGWPTTIEVSNLFKIETKRFPLLRNIACGEPIFADEEQELYVAAGRTSASRPRETA